MSIHLEYKEIIERIAYLENILKNIGQRGLMDCEAEVKELNFLRECKKICETIK